MQVQKRDGTLIEVSFDKVIKRLRILCNKTPKLITIDPIQIAQKVCSQIYSGIPTSKLDELSAEICISNTTKHLPPASSISCIHLSCKAVGFLVLSALHSIPINCPPRIATLSGTPARPNGPACGL